MLEIYYPHFTKVNQVCGGLLNFANFQYWICWCASAFKLYHFVTIYVSKRCKRIMGAINEIRGLFCATIKRVFIKENSMTKGHGKWANICHHALVTIRRRYVLQKSAKMHLLIATFPVFFDGRKYHPYFCWRSFSCTNYTFSVRHSATSTFIASNIYIKMGPSIFCPFLRIFLK